MHPIRSAHRPRPRRAGSALLALAAVLCVGAGCGDGEEEGDFGSDPPVVESAIVRSAAVENVARFVGQLETAESVVVKPEISGVVAEVHFEEGQPVEQGQLLVRLRDAEQRALVAEARARLAQAEDEYARSKRLAKQDARSQAELIRAKSDFEIAQARLELAEIALSRTRIHAPFSGVAGERLISTGERVSPGGSDRFGGNSTTGIARIEALDRMELIVTVPETVAGRLRAGLTLTLTVASQPGHVFPGEVFFLAPRVNEQNRRMLVKAAVPNPEHRLRPGMFAKVEMPIGRIDEALMIPEDAVRYQREGPEVWRIGPDAVAEAVPVELGVRQEGRVHVVTGLRDGDQIVVSGIHKVRDGDEVEAILREAPLGVGEGTAEAAAAVSPEPPEAGT